MHAPSTTPTTERRARPRGPGCSACTSQSNTHQACPAPQACEAPDLLDPGHNDPTPGEEITGLLLIVLAAVVCALALVHMPPGA